MLLYEVTITWNKCYDYLKNEWKSPDKRQKTQDFSRLETSLLHSEFARFEWIQIQKIIGQAHDPNQKHAMHSQNTSVEHNTRCLLKKKAVKPSASCICYMFQYANYYIPFYLLIFIGGFIILPHRPTCGIKASHHKETRKTWGFQLLRQGGHRVNDAWDERDIYLHEYPPGN